MQLRTYVLHVIKREITLFAAFYCPLIFVPPITNPERSIGAAYAFFLLAAELAAAVVDAAAPPQFFSNFYRALLEAV